MGSNVISFEELMKSGGKAKAAAGKVRTRDVKAFMDELAKQKKSQIDASNAFVKDVIGEASRYLTDVIGVGACDLVPRPGVEDLLVNSKDMIRRMCSEPTWAFGAYPDDGGEYEVGLTFPPELLEQGRTKSLTLSFRRRLNGFVELFDCAEMKWVVAFTPSKEYASDEIINEVKNHSQKGRFATDYLSEILTAGETISPDQLDEAVRRSELLVDLLTKHPNDLAVKTNGAGRPFLVTVGDYKGTAIGSEGNEYVLMQYLDEDAVWTLCDPADFSRYASDPENYESEDDEYDGYEEYELEVGRTSDPEVVERFVETMIKRRSGDEEPAFRIPLSWNKVYEVRLAAGVLDAIKRNLLHGGFEQEEKQALRAFRNEFSEELEAVDGGK